MVNGTALTSLAGPSVQVTRTRAAVETVIVVAQA